jgi:aminoglycoside phosphotransferase (APT) family kinase protein
MTNQDVYKLAEIEFGNKQVHLKKIRSGVMTHKYECTVDKKPYIIRVFPKGRESSSLIETKYINLCKDNDVLVPSLLKTHTNEKINNTSYIIYEKLEGFTLSSVYSKLNQSQRESITHQIVKNLSRMNEIKLTGFGVPVDDKRFSDLSWLSFVNMSISRGTDYLTQNKILEYNQLNNLLRFMNEQLSKINTQPNLIWSDLSMHNIIVQGDKLIGFIDFDGIMSGDPMLQYGYLFAKDSNSDFLKRIIRNHGQQISYEQLYFYAILRYLRLIPYSKNQLPNGAYRMPIQNFLKGSERIINSINKSQFK